VEAFVIISSFLWWMFLLAIHNSLEGEGFWSSTRKEYKRIRGNNVKGIQEDAERN
jgi:hypothetical protein